MCGGLPERALIQSVNPVSTRNGIIKISHANPTEKSVRKAISPISASTNPRGIAPASPMKSLAGGQLNQSNGAQQANSTADSHANCSLGTSPKVAISPIPTAMHSACVDTKPSAPSMKFTRLMHQAAATPAIANTAILANPAGSRNQQSRSPAAR